MAREIIIGPRGEFTPEAIVRLALRQEISHDDAASMT